MFKSIYHCIDLEYNGLGANVYSLKTVEHVAFA